MVEMEIIPRQPKPRSGGIMFSESMTQSHTLTGGYSTTRPGRTTAPARTITYEQKKRLNYAAHQSLPDRPWRIPGNNASEMKR